MRVLLFSDFGLPCSCAAATRVINIAKLLKKMGHCVDLLGVSYKNGEALSGCYDSIEYAMLKAPSYTGFYAYKRVGQLEKELENYLRNRTYDVVILSNIYYDMADVLRRYAQGTGAYLIINAVEWYDRNDEQFSGLFGVVKFVKNRIALKYIHRKMRNILAISSFLDAYYKKRGCNTITIPTIVDPAEYEAVVRREFSNDKTVKIAYAGSPARKDYILNAILAVGMLTEKQKSRLELHLYGPERAQLVALGIPEAYLQQHETSIICHGRIPYEQVKERISAADFTVLLRPNKRYANAGFPTKVGESMACGTPVIANLTSDLNKYIIDNETGIVCKDESAQSCADAFRHALVLTREERNKMRINALRMAKQSFNYEQYAESFQAFLEKCYAVQL